MSDYRPGIYIVRNLNGALGVAVRSVYLEWWRIGIADPAPELPDGWEIVAGPFTAEQIAALAEILAGKAALARRTREQDAELSRLKHLFRMRGWR